MVMVIPKRPFAKDCRQSIMKRFGKSQGYHWSIKLLESIFSHMDDPALRQSIYDKEGFIVLTEAVFDDPKRWRAFYSQYKSNERMFCKNHDEDNLFCDIVLTKILQNHYRLWLTEKTVKSETSSIRDQEEEGIRISNIYTLQEFRDEYPDVKIDINGYDEADSEAVAFIPNELVDLQDIHTLINKEPSFFLLPNPAVEKSETLYYDKSNQIQKVQIEIVRKVLGEDINTMIISEYEYRCPRCGKRFTRLPFQTHQTVQHNCGTSYPSPMKTVDKGGKKKSNYRNIYLYEVKYSSPNNHLKDSWITQGEQEEKYIFSFHQNLQPGRYEADILLSVDMTDIEGSFIKNCLAIQLLLGYKRITPDVNEELLTDEEAKAWCEANNLPYVKLLSILFSIRKIHENYTKMNITDKGMLMQIMVTFSGVCKLLFGFDKFAVGAMGNTSLGKTYIGVLFSMLLDRNYYYIQSSEDVSGPGLKGGINSNMLINGATVKMFEYGLVTKAGMCIFDEGSNFYRSTTLNEALKNLFEPKLTIGKVGGKSGIPQNYTPIIYSNFTEFKNEYQRQIEEAYLSLYKKAPNDKKATLAHGSQRREILNYLHRTNLYLPEFYYMDIEKNDLLAQASAYVRQKLRLADLDWRTGGSVPASYRLLFDVVCWNFEKKGGSRKLENSEVVLPEMGQVPYEEFQATLKQAFRGGEINLKHKDRNSEERQEQLRMLYEDIRAWLTNGEGASLHKHLSHNCDKVDPKLASLVVKFMQGLQLLEDINSVKLSTNVKKFAYLVLMRCKRGVTEEEYDFGPRVENHTYVEIDYVSTELEVQEVMEQEKREAEADASIRQSSLKVSDKEEGDEIVETGSGEPGDDDLLDINI